MIKKLQTIVEIAAVTFVFGFAGMYLYDVAKEKFGSKPLTREDIALVLNK